MSVTTGLPSVIVPVLSKTTALTLRASSRLSASLMSMPCSAPRPRPTIIAVGVASPSAHGHAITNTVTRAMIPWVSPLGPPQIVHMASVSNAIPMTTGTNMPAILSASFCTGALLPWASCTIFMICASTVSLPVFSALN